MRGYSYPGPTEPMYPEDCSLRWPPDGRPSTGGYPFEYLFRPAPVEAWERFGVQVVAA